MTYSTQNIIGYRNISILQPRLGGHFAADDAAAAQGRALGTLTATVQREAFTLAHIDAFRLSFWVAVGGLLPVACMGASPPGPFAPKRLPATAPPASSRQT